MELNGKVEKFESLEQIEVEMYKVQNIYWKKDKYINLLEKRLIELKQKRTEALKRFENLDQIRGNFAENYQLIK